MKARRMKLTACLLAGAILFSTGAAPAMAGGAKDAADLPMAGFSLALADVDLEEEDRLSQDIKQEAEEAAREQEAAEQALYRLMIMSMSEAEPRKIVRSWGEWKTMR